MEPQPAHKQQVSGLRHRLNMVWLALRNQAHMELLQLEHDTFTVAHTLPWLEEKF